MPIQADQNISSLQPGGPRTAAFCSRAHKHAHTYRHAQFLSHLGRKFIHTNAQARAAREIFSRQQLDGFGFDVEVLFIARRLGYRVLETPVRWNDVAGTKVSLLRGVAAFLDPLKVRWNDLLGRYR